MRTLKGCTHPRIKWKKGVARSPQKVICNTERLNQVTRMRCMLRSHLSPSEGRLTLFSSDDPFARTLPAGCQELGQGRGLARKMHHSPPPDIGRKVLKADPAHTSF